jgi:predicted membrane chloride channel (bestrophin family)
MELLIILMTYGFMGIELLFVEIDDPFAEDPNDLPVTEEARAAGEDIMLSLLHMDGRAAVTRMRTIFQGNVHDDTELATKETDPLI